jgi:methionine-rich copper-binding protein CopC
MLVALTPTLAPTASAHAPIEWSEPKAYANVTELPDTVKVRFANEPVRVTMRTIEPEPRAGISLEPVRISARTYEVILPSTVITPTDNRVLIFIETLSADGHTESGVYLFNVVDPLVSTTTSTTTSPPVTIVTTNAVAGTTPTAVFVPPADTKSTVTQLWVICGVLALLGSALVIYRVRKRN